MRKEQIAERVTALILAAGIAASLAACGSGSTGSSQASAAGAVQTSEAADGQTQDTKAEDGDLPVLKVGLVTTGAVRPALVVAANELGYYEEEGVKVEFVTIESTNSGLTALGQGKLNVVPYAVVPQLNQIAQGNNLVIFGGTASEGSSMVKGKGNEDVDFRDYNNWAGKKINYSSGNTTYTLLRQLLRTNGVDPDSVDWQEFTEESQVLEALKKGSLDAGFMTEEFTIVGEKAGLQEAFQLAEILGNYVCCRQTADREYYEANQDTYKKFLKAQIRTLNDYKNDTPKVIQAVADYIEQDYSYVERYIATPNDIDTGSFVKYKNPVSPDPLYNKVEELWDSEVAEGVITPKDGVELKDHVDVSLYEQAVKELIDEYPDDETYPAILESFEENNSSYS